MKNLILILTVLLFASCSSSKNGIAVTGFQTTDNYWQNQSKKVVHRNQRYAKLEKRTANKEDKMMKKVLKFKAKEKKKSKRLVAQSFDFH